MQSVLIVCRIVYRFGAYSAESALIVYRIVYRFGAYSAECAKFLKSETAQIRVVSYSNRNKILGSIMFSNVNYQYWERWKRGVIPQGI